MKDLLAIFGAVMLVAGCVAAAFGLWAINHINATVEQTSAEYQRQQQAASDRHREQMAKIQADGKAWQQNFAEASRLDREAFELRAERRKLDVRSPEYREATNRLASIQAQKGALDAARAELDMKSSNADGDIAAEMEFMNSSLRAQHRSARDQWRAVTSARVFNPIFAALAIAGGLLVIAGVIVLFHTPRRARLRSATG